MITPRLKILLSYHYFRNVDLDEFIGKNFGEPYPEVFIDSGAFSAMTQGANISLEEYAEYLTRYKHWITVCANLDVIRHADLSWTNQRKLEDMGHNPLPVFHVSEEWEWLEHYVERYPYIALGVAGAKPPQYMGWVVKCFQIAAGRSVFHGFGITTWQALKAFRWHSVDSSSWGMGFRYGTVPVFDPRHGKFQKLDLRDRKAWYSHARLVRSYGYDPEDFVDPARYHYLTAAGLSAMSYVEAEQWVKRRHGEIPIPNFLEGQARLYSDSPPGLKLYIVDGSTTNLIAAQEAFRRYSALKIAEVA